nr:MAG TPA: hypothetical protein [Caudoviricetes sp.]
MLNTTGSSFARVNLGSRCRKNWQREVGRRR